MTKHVVYLGAAPPDEPRVRPDDPRFRAENALQCAAYIRAIVRCCGEPPPGVTLHARPGDYEFGRAREVALEFSLEDEGACRYAQYCEEMGPRTWADAGMEPPGRRETGGRKLR